MRAIVVREHGPCLDTVARHDDFVVPFPKRRLERLFCLFCAGSDGRLLMLSIGLVVSELTGDGLFLLWLLWAMAAAVYVNFLVRIGLVYRHFRAGDPAES